jgi:transposase
VLKSDIEIAPVYHRLPERIRAHALICFLALVLNRVMRLRMKANGSPYSPQRALELLSRIQKHRVQIDGKTFEGIGRIAPEQRDIFEALALPEPANRRL